MLSPKKVKHRKWHKGRSRAKVAARGAKLSFGSFGIKAEGEQWINARQIEAARRAIIHFIEKRGKIWVRIFPDKPVTTKGNEVPMGHGKGAVDRYVAPVKPGQVIFEIDGVTKEIAQKAMYRAAAKLPVKTRFISR
ncbi:MAG: 50S ribosomal protein L16 [Parcubacteria group bacterium]|nr:50S ribosomal protein L16 [Parcubacteria group bacterium]